MINFDFYQPATGEKNLDTSYFGNITNKDKAGMKVLISSRFYKSIFLVKKNDLENLAEIK